MTAHETGTRRCGGGPTGASAVGGLALDWAAILTEHGRWLRTVVRSRLGEDQAVDEVMQDVSLAAVAQKAPVGDSSRVGAWLYQVAVRQALMHRRRHGRQRRLVDRYARAEAPSDSGPASEPDPLVWLLVGERDRLVREAVDRLPDVDRELFLLKYTEGWTCRELAVRLGQSESAVEARLHRARRRLRAWLADAMEEPSS